MGRQLPGIWPNTTVFGTSRSSRRDIGGGGNTARNTAVIRSNYLTEEGVNFYRESVDLFGNLSNELGYNIMLENRGQLTLAHSDAAMRSLRWRAEVNQHLSVRSEMLDRQAIRELAPNLAMSEDARFPILGGLWHADGATGRHDAVAWGYARGACEQGVELHQLTEVVGLKVKNGRIAAMETNRGTIECGVTVQAVAGTSSVVADMAGIKLPIHNYPLQAMVARHPLRSIRPPRRYGSIPTVQSLQSLLWVKILPTNGYPDSRIARNVSKVPCQNLTANHQVASAHLRQTAARCSIVSAKMASSSQIQIMAIK